MALEHGGGRDAPGQAPSGLARLAEASLVHVDARVLALYMTGGELSAQTRFVMAGIRAGEIRAQTSIISLYQILSEVYRQQTEPAFARTVARRIQLYPSLNLVPVNAEVAIQAAEVRAQLGGRPERAIQIATALVSRAQIYLAAGWGIRRIAGMNVVDISDLDFTDAA